MNNVFLPFNIQPQARLEGLLTQEARDEILVYDLNTNRAFCLNLITAAVWSQCDGQKNIREIIAALKKDKQIASDENLIWLTLHELNKQSLLVKTEKIGEISRKINRRELIKRVALGTAFMLPVISFITAPTAVYAQSCGQSLCSPSTLNQPCCDANNPSGFGFCTDVGAPIGQVIAQCLTVCNAPVCSPATLNQPCCGVSGDPLKLGFCANVGAPINQIVPLCV